MRCPTVLCILALAGASQLHAQRPDGRSAEQVMRAFLLAAEQARWEDAARLLDAEPLERQREQVLTMARSYRAPSPISAAALARIDSTMPREVAEWMARREREHAYRWDQADLLVEFARVSDTVTLIGLSPLELGARWLEAQDMRYQVSRSLAQLGNQELACRALLEAQPIPASRWELLGIVTKGDTAWSLHREVGQPPPEGDRFEAIEQPMIAALIRRSSRWVIIPDRPLLSYVSAGLSSLACFPADSTLPPR